MANPKFYYDDTLIDLHLFDSFKTSDTSSDYIGTYNFIGNTATGFWQDSLKIYAEPKPAYYISHVEFSPTDNLENWYINSVILGTTLPIGQTVGVSSIRLQVVKLQGGYGPSPTQTTVVCDKTNTGSWDFRFRIPIDKNYLPYYGGLDLGSITGTRYRITLTFTRSNGAQFGVYFPYLFLSGVVYKDVIAQTDGVLGNYWRPKVVTCAASDSIADRSEFLNLQTGTWSYTI